MCWSPKREDKQTALVKKRGRLDQCAGVEQPNYKTREDKHLYSVDTVAAAITTVGVE